MIVDAIKHPATGNPFDLHEQRAYPAWREQKLAQYPASVNEIVVPIANPLALSAAERNAILDACGRANMAMYAIQQPPDMDKSLVAALGEQFGLRRLDSNLYADDDGISALQVSAERRQFEYIPYSNRAISWHTDGYYNAPERRVRAMVLHCARPAASGGENTLLDHEMLYIQLRDENPDYIAAFMQPDVMTIPANVENGVVIRPEQTGPVFALDEQTGCLHMRYTARTRSIEWKQDKLTQSAVGCLEALLAADSPYVFRHRLAAGQGVICNNVLHARSAFEDDEATGQRRLFFRARYYDRIT